MGGKPALERLAQHVARLRQRALGRVDQQHHAVDHRQHALDFPTEIRVARRVDDVDDDVLIVNRGVLGQDRDAALALEFVAVHRALGDPLVGAKHTGLPKHRVDQRGLAMVHVRHDRDVAAEGVGNRGAYRMRTEMRKTSLQYRVPWVPEVPGCPGIAGSGCFGSHMALKAHLSRAPRHARHLRHLRHPGPRAFPRESVLFCRHAALRVPVPPVPPSVRAAGSGANGPGLPIVRQSGTRQTVVGIRGRRHHDDPAGA